ncbi:unnamed protein product, partial [Phytomonas sp. EM1]
MFPSNVDDLAAALFYGGVPEGVLNENAGKRMKRLNTYQTISVSLENLYNGCTLPVNLTRYVLCTNCAGRGTRKKNKSMLRCMRCGGAGSRIEVQQMGMMIQQVEATCNVCNGTGTRIDPAACCRTCHGNKVVEIKDSIVVEIHPGTRHEDYIYLQKMGNEYPGYASAGDLIIQVSQEPHPFFERSQNDLHMKREISLAEALCGTRFKVVHLDGRELIVTRKRGEITYPGEQKCVRGEGMPIRDTSKFGDLYIEFIVNYPEHIDDNQIRLLSAAFTEPGRHPVCEQKNGESNDVEEYYASREDIEILKKEIRLDEMSEEDDDEGDIVGCQTQ